MYLLKISFLIAVLVIQYALIPSHGMGVGVSISPPTPSVEIEGNLHLRQALNAQSDEEIITILQAEMATKGIDQLIAELAQKLTISDMEKLYSILIQQEQMEPLALRLWEFRDQRVKLESASLLADPRIIFIAKSKEIPAAFWMGLSDGSFWKVDPSHMGGDDPLLQKILINSLLGDYVIKRDGSENLLFPQLVEVRTFPVGGFFGYMEVEEIEQGVSLKGKDVYYLGIGGFFK